MLEFSSARYTPQQVLTVFRAITDHLKRLPFAFAAQGVFRVSGDPSHVQQIMANILMDNQFVDHRFSIHDYIGALKYAIKYSNLLAPNIPALTKFKSKVRTKNDRKIKTAIPTLIQDLVNANDEVQGIAAEILYLYGHLLSHAYILQVKNKMNAENLGIIAGPLFANLIADDNPQNTMADTLKLNDVCAYLIHNGLFQASAPDGILSLLSRTLALFEEEDLQAFLQKRPVFLGTSFQEMPANPLMQNPYNSSLAQQDDEWEPVRNKYK
ncbi:MAG: RhoGAP domain-containing protein [Candidatus Berkiella sp.]